MHGLVGERVLMRIHIGERDKHRGKPLYEAIVKLLRIHIGERDKHRGKPLYEAIVKLLRERHYAGATVFRAIMGFGPTARLHTDKVLRLSVDLPLVIECVDTEDKINAILPELDTMLEGGLITLERARVITYRAHEGPPADSG